MSDLTKREWILVITLVVVVEYLTILTVYNLGSDKEVVDRIGFASAIVSILLGLVAIGYALYQSYSQKVDTERIATQLDRLGATTDKAGQVADQMSLISAMLERVASKVDDTEQSVGEIFSMLRKELSGSAFPSEPDTKETTDAQNDVSGAENIARQEGLFIDDTISVEYMLLLFLAKKDGKHYLVADSLIKDFLEMFGDSGPESTADSWLEGYLLSFVRSYTRIGVLRRGQDAGLQLATEARKAVLASVEERRSHLHAHLIDVFDKIVALG